MHEIHKDVYAVDTLEIMMVPEAPLHPLFKDSFLLLGPPPYLLILLLLLSDQHHVG